MGKVLVIGCGGVASVAIQKCAMNSEVFDEICIASRTVSKCDALKEQLKGKIKSKNHDRAGRCGQSDGPGRTYQESTAGRCIKSGVTVSGSDDYGCLSGDWRTLC